jgi:hypothetical protein
MYRLAIAFLAIAFAPASRAQTDFEVWPIEEAEGVSHFSECNSDICTLWVRLPKGIAAAQLTYPDEDRYQLWAPLSVVELPQERVGSMLSIDPAKYTRSCLAAFGDFSYRFLGGSQNEHPSQSAQRRAAPCIGSSPCPLGSQVGANNSFKPKPLRGSA